MSTTHHPRANLPGTGLEPGDRFEVSRAGAGDRLSLPRVLGPGGFAFDRLEDPAGRPLDMAFDPVDRQARVPELGHVLKDPGSTLWLEYQQPGHFRLVADRAAS